MNHRPLVFIDIETTGAAALNSRVLEIGAIRVENNRIVKQYNQIIDPQEPIPYFISNLTGIKDEHVWGMPSFKDIASEIEDLFQDALFVAHNVSFDYGFIREEFRRIGVTFKNDRMCTVRLSRALYPAQKSHRLDEVIRVHGYKVVNRHRAFDDAEVLYKFYRDHYQKHGIDLYRTMNKLIVATR